MVYSDDLDRASELEQMARDDQIRQASNYVKRLPKVPGECDWCEDPTPSVNHLFCCLDCSKADALFNDRMKARGRTDG